MGKLLAYAQGLHVCALYVLFCEDDAGAGLPVQCSAYMPASERERQSNQVAVKETEGLTDRGDEAGKPADSSTGLLAHRPHISTQLHLQKDVWRETERQTKTATDTAGDREEDIGCSSKDPFSNQQGGPAIFRHSHLNNMDTGYEIWF